MSSAIAGYLNPTGELPIPGGLTFLQFLQTVVVGISGYPNTSVWPRWQVQPPPRPDINVDWVAFGIESNTPDANAYTGLDSNNNFSLSRKKTLDMLVSFYGPNSGENVSIFTDGFQLTQNVAALNSASMGYQDASSARHAPELINERWFDRWDVNITLVYQVLRTYNVLSFASATFTINTEVAEGPYASTFTVES